MQEQRAREILRALIQGVDPFNGQELAASSVLQHAEVLRALLAGIASLEESAARSARRAHLPANVGRAWTPEEEVELVRATEAREDIQEIAVRHARTVRAIEARLEKLGLISAADRITRNGFDGTAKK